MQFEAVWGKDFTAQKCFYLVYIIKKSTNYLIYDHQRIILTNAGIFVNMKQKCVN